ncbi:MAG: hypothetical protein SV760_03390, partial [Halobacteria archaeon]|nr:hypothetical protein [Halobacteria archaeon]
PLRIGASGPGGSRHFNGRIDEVRLYDTFLNDSQVEELYKTSVRLSPDNPDGNPMKNTTLTLGEEPADISSVSTRRRVAYITSRGINDTKNVGTVIVKVEIW